VAKVKVDYICSLYSTAERFIYVIPCGKRRSTLSDLGLGYGFYCRVEGGAIPEMTLLFLSCAGKRSHAAKIKILLPA